MGANFGGGEAHSETYSACFNKSFIFLPLVGSDLLLIALSLERHITFYLDITSYKAMKLIKLRAVTKQSEKLRK